MDQLLGAWLSSNHWLGSIETYTFLWYLMLVSANHASNSAHIDKCWEINSLWRQCDQMVGLELWWSWSTSSPALTTTGFVSGPPWFNYSAQVKDYNETSQPVSLSPQLWALESVYRRMVLACLLACVLYHMSSISFCSASDKGFSMPSNSHSVFVYNQSESISVQLWHT